MMIEVVVTGITNMKDDHLCMSGYSNTEKKYRRPLVEGRAICFSDLIIGGQELTLGSTIGIDIIPSQTIPTAPHIEDTYITLPFRIIKKHESRTEFRKYLLTIAEQSIDTIFGPYIELLDDQPVIPSECGTRSLGTIIARECKVYLNSKGQTRVDIKDKNGKEYRNIPCVAKDDWIKPIGCFENPIVRLSLSRLWQKPHGVEPFFWMQVSGVVP